MVRSGSASSASRGDTAGLRLKVSVLLSREVQAPTQIHDRLGRVSEVLNFYLMPTAQVDTMSPKSSVPQAANSVS